MTKNVFKVLFWTCNTLKKTLRSKIIRNLSSSSGKYSIDSTEVSIAVRFELNKENKGEDKDGKCVLSLNTSEPLYPIYAFLPTKTAIFRFVF
jgi:hypothetical protein